MDNKNKNRGFSGLSDLASNVNGVNEIVMSPSSKAEKSSSAKEHTSTSKVVPRKESKPQSKASHQPIETMSGSKSVRSTGIKWIFGIIAAIIIVWSVNSGEQPPQRSSYSSQNSSKKYNNKNDSIPAVQKSSKIQSTGLKYEEPPIGTNKKLWTPQIRWCIRETIRIETMRDIIDTNEGRDEFNRIVNNYNSRCGNYQYRQGSLQSAKRDVEAYRDQIISEAILTANQLDRSSQSSKPSAKRPNTQYAREIQTLLTDIGYNPGPVDGLYGRKTANAVKAFQRDIGLTPDGRIDQNFLNLLKQSKATVTEQSIQQNQTNDLRKFKVQSSFQGTPEDISIYSSIGERIYEAPPSSSTTLNIPYISDEAMIECVKLYNEAKWLNEDIKTTIVNEYSQQSIDAYNKKITHHFNMTQKFNRDCAGRQSESAYKAAKELNKKNSN